MSGSSTLRICLAAMAPALTEAATARLKLQDTSGKKESLIAAEKTNNDHISPLSQKPRTVKSGDLQVPEGCSRSKAGGRVSHLPFTSAESNRTRVDPKRSSPCDSGNTKLDLDLSLSSDVAPHTNTLSKFKAHSLKRSDIARLYIPERIRSGVVASKETHQFADNLKIMNQPQIAADRSREEQCTVEIKRPVNCSVSDKREEAVHSAHSTKIKILPSVMVNGDNELSRKSECDESVKDCNEKGDAPVRKDKHLLEGRSVHFTLTDTQRETQNSPSEMGMCTRDVQISQNMESASKSESQADDKSKDEMRKECVKRQAFLERKVDTLLRRLKRMKGKVVEAHTKEELRQFVNFQHRNLQNVAKTIKNETPGPEELKEHFLSNEEVKNMSTAQLVKLVKTYQPNRTVAITESTTTKLGLFSGSAVVMDPTIRSQSLRASEKLGQRVQTTTSELDSDATASSSGGESGDEDNIPLPQIPADLPPLLKRAEWKWARDRAAVVARWTWLQAQVSDLEYRIRQQSQVHRQLRNSKGGVVLGDQPTAVEILRRLQGIPPRPATTEGGAVTDSSSCTEVSPCNVSAVMSNIDKQASRLTQSLGNCLSPASSALGSPAGSSSKISSPYVNGLTDSPSGSSTTTESVTTAENSPMVPTELRLFGKTSDLLEQNTPADATCQAARCRPLRSYRKRKILRTIGLYKTSHKAARLSDVRCRCYPPANPCPICGGRYNNTQTLDPDTMSYRERVALLDPSFHPVLSFLQDIHLPIHCEGLLKSGLWQNKPPPRRSRVGEYRRSKVITLVTEPVRKGDNNRQNGRSNNTPSVINFSAKIKNKYESKTKAKGTATAATTKGASLKQRGNKAKRKAAKMAREAFKKVQPDEDEDEDLEALYLDQEVNTPSVRDTGLSCSASQSSLKDMQHQRKRKVDNSFDINNIVIPLSMAASTRVEQPQYKEIVTPKWRELSDLSTEAIESSLTKKLEKTNGVSLSSDQHKLVPEEEVEDLSDEKFAARHLTMEMEEKKRYRNFVQYPPVRRSRARSDAVCSSGTSSSLVAEGKAGTDLETKTEGTVADESTMSSRPSTPVLNKSLPAYLHHTALEDSMDALQHQLSVRRRTMSFTKRERSSSIISDDLHFHPLIDYSGVEPWPRRTFPLSVEEYQEMQEDLPPSCEPVHQRVTRHLAEPSGKVYVGGSVDNPDDIVSAAPSPHPSNESASSAGDDPNDPEWVGARDVSKRNKHHKRVVSDDPNDPEWTGTDTPRKGKNRR